MSQVIEAHGDSPELLKGQQEVFERSRETFNEVFDRQIEKGYNKYGVHLHTFNKRDPGNDAMEEAVDLLNYLTQLRMEHKVFAQLLYGVYMTSSALNHVPASVIRTIRTIASGTDWEHMFEEWSDDEDAE